MTLQGCASEAPCTSFTAKVMPTGTVSVEKCHLLAETEYHDNVWCFVKGLESRGTHHFLLSRILLVDLRGFKVINGPCSPQLTRLAGDV